VIEITEQRAKEIMELAELAHKPEHGIEVRSFVESPRWFRSKNEDDLDREDEIEEVQLDGEGKTEVENDSTARAILVSAGGTFQYVMWFNAGDYPDTAASEEIKVEELKELL
jgi:hypothetical protein